MHAYHQSQMDATADKCARCGRPQVDHTDQAECEACGSIGPCELFVDNLYCAAKCYPAEIEAQASLKASAPQRVNDSHTTQSQAISALSSDSLKADSGTELDMNFFNMQTNALRDEIRSIESDPDIQNKPYARAKFTIAWIKRLELSAQEHKKEALKADCGVRAGQVYLNSMIKDLREDERTQFREHDIDYPVTKSIKPKSKSQSTGQAEKKAKKSTGINWIEVKKWVEISGFTQSAVHSMMEALNCSPEVACRKLARLAEIDDSKWSG